MRGLRILLTAMLLALLPAAALAQQPAKRGGDSQFALRDIDCAGMTVVGKGLRAKATVRLTLVDRDSGRVLVRRTVHAAANGRFSARLEARMNGILGMRVLIASAKGTRLGFVDHTMAKGAPMCRLPYTGPFQSSLAIASAGLLAAGTLLLRRTRGRNAYWPSADLD